MSFRKFSTSYAVIIINWRLITGKIVLTEVFKILEINSVYDAW